MPSTTCSHADCANTPLTLQDLSDDGNMGEAKNTHKLKEYNIKKGRNYPRKFFPAYLQNEFACRQSKRQVFKLGYSMG